ncbi:MAG: tetratricopeptide repeat protein [Lewinellaceae bacterium]|nr:tetratricopeptide repeat protein [Lewinellaceae bacterium]
MRKHLPIFLLLFFVQIAVDAQHALLDSFRLVLQKETDPVKKADIYYEIALEAMEMDLDVAFRCADTLESMSKSARYPIGQARAMGIRGTASKDKGDFEAAMRIFKDELAFRRKIEDPKGLGKVYNNIGATFGDLYQPDSAVTYYLKAVDIYEKLGDHTNIASAYSNIGNLYRDQKAHDKAITYLEKALKIRLEHGEEKKSIYTYNNLAVAYGSKGDLDKAMEYSNKGVEIALKYGNKYVAGVILGGICHLLHKQGRNREAIPFGERSVEYLEAVNRKANLVFLLVNLAGVYNTLGQPEVALEKRAMPSCWKPTRPTRWKFITRK